ncbi:hypothetical protein GmHk_01G000544 [Glycine max]|nr:hypothetical protein GmHk_01G000544 [Glycine max]
MSSRPWRTKLPCTVYSSKESYMKEVTNIHQIRLIRQVSEVLIFIHLLSQSSGLASHPLSATLLG